MAYFKLKNACVDDVKEPVNVCAIFDNSHECNAAAEQIIRLPITINPMLTKKAT